MNGEMFGEMAARPEKPDICGEQRVEDDIRGRKGAWRSHLPASLRLGTRVPFPPNPLTKHSFAPRESGAYHLPKFPTR